MTGNYSEEMGAVKSDLQTLKEDLATLTKSVKTDAQANASELRANAKTKLKAARENAMDAGTKGREKARVTFKENRFGNRSFNGSSLIIQDSRQNRRGAKIPSPFLWLRISYVVSRSSVALQKPAVNYVRAGPTVVLARHGSLL